MDDQAVTHGRGRRAARAALGAGIFSVLSMGAALLLALGPIQGDANGRITLTLFVAGAIASFAALGMGLRELRGDESGAAATAVTFGAIGVGVVVWVAAIVLTFRPD